MFLLEQQYDLNAKFFFIFNILISLFFQGGSPSSQIIVFKWSRILNYVEQRLAEEVNFFINIDIRMGS